MANDIQTIQNLIYEIRGQRVMFDVEYLVLAVRNEYRTHKDFDIIYQFLETLYISNRLHLPLKGVLLIGY